MHIVRPILRTFSLLIQSLLPRPSEAVAILMYHRISGDLDLELDLPVSVFKTQMEALAETGRVVSLDEALHALSKGWPDSKLRYVITFDDAYEDFYTTAWPILEELQLPAVLYVPTGFLENPNCPPITRNGVGEEHMRPITWGMLKEISASSLITIGSHTHSHPDIPELSKQQLMQELEQCDNLLEKHLGYQPEHFGYPRGVWDNRVRQVVEPRYRSVVRAEGGLARMGTANSLHLPRTPILRSDGMKWFNHRITGRLALEEKIIATIKRARQALRASFAGGR